MSKSVRFREDVATYNESLLAARMAGGRVRHLFYHSSRKTWTRLTLCEGKRIGTAYSGTGIAEGSSYWCLDSETPRCKACPKAYAKLSAKGI